MPLDIRVSQHLLLMASILGLLGKASVTFAEPVTIPRAIKTWKPNHHTTQSHPHTQKVSTTLTSGAACPPVAVYDPNIRHPAVDQNYLPGISGG